MSDARKAARSDVRIDRLVLDIPGLDPADARTLARAIGDGLAQSGAAAEHRAISRAALARRHDARGHGRA